MNKADILKLIIARLNGDLELLFNAALTAHAAATHEENLPDNKYDTLALEASYLAQGQANRASELRQALALFKQLDLAQQGSNEIRLASLVTLASAADTRIVFIGPLEGGLKVMTPAGEVMVITPASPLGRELLGKETGDAVEVGSGGKQINYEIVEVK